MSVIEVVFILRFPQVTCDAKSLLSVACLQFHELARDCMQFYKLGKNMHAVPLAFKKLACRCIIMSSLRLSDFAAPKNFTVLVSLCVKSNNHIHRSIVGLLWW